MEPKERLRARVQDATLAVLPEGLKVEITPQAATGMSRGASANALSRLERRGLLERPATKRGPNASRRIVDVDSFIDQYTEAAGEFRKRQKVVRVHRLWVNPLDVLDIEIGPR